MTGSTPKYGIPYPDGTTKANKLGDELAAMGLGVEAALEAAGIPNVTNPDRAVASSDQARDEHFGKPSSEAERLALQRRGAECVRTDKGYTERYFATYDATTNPSGITPAGWYPVAGGALGGRTNGAGSDTGWIRAGNVGGPVLAPNYGNLDSSAVPWQGYQARRKNGFVTVSGAGTKSTAIAALETAMTMPDGWRPLVTAAGFASVGATTTICLVRPDGTLTTAASGVAGSQLTVAITYPV